MVHAHNYTNITTRIILWIYKQPLVHWIIICTQTWSVMSIWLVLDVYECVFMHALLEKNTVYWYVFLVTTAVTTALLYPLSNLTPLWTRTQYVWTLPRTIHYFTYFEVCYVQHNPDIFIWSSKTMWRPEHIDNLTAIIWYRWHVYPSF